MTIKFNKGKALGTLSMTPLIDVVFLLLIFFLVATRLSQEDRELDIPLPSAANAMPMTTEPQEFIVNIDDRGALFMDGEYLQDERFEALLRRAVADNPLGQSVIIRADRRVPVQRPVEVMDLCLKLGAAYSLSIAEEES